MRLKISQSNTRNYMLYVQGGEYNQKQKLFDQMEENLAQALMI